MPARKKEAPNRCHNPKKSDENTNYIINTLRSPVNSSNSRLFSPHEKYYAQKDAYYCLGYNSANLIPVDSGAGPASKGSSRRFTALLPDAAGLLLSFPVRRKLR